jgi:hypothetical protein
MPRRPVCQEPFLKKFDKFLGTDKETAQSQA